MRKMFIFLFMLMSASLFLTSCEQPAANNANRPAIANANSATASTAGNEADVKKFISDLGAALAKNDAAALDKMWADDYTFVSPDGEVLTKAQRLDAVKSGAMKFESLAFNDVKVRIYGDTAVVAAKTTAKGTMNGKDNSGTSTATIVVVKGKDGWRVVLGHPSTPQAAAKTAEPNTASNANKAAPPANK